MMVDAIDHVVLTSSNIDKTIYFFVNVLEMTLKKSKSGNDSSIRYSLHFGKQKINIHEHKSIFSPHAFIARPGTLDVCFISKKKLSYWINKFKINNIKILEGPVERIGAYSKLISIYCNDPDGNLIEVSNSINNND